MVQQVEAAKEWGWSPSAILREAKNPRKPHVIDYALALAVKTIGEEKCSRCGTPAHWAYSTDDRIAFELEDLTCQACAEIEKAEEAQKERPKGTVKIAHVVPVSYEDGTTEELPTRGDFFERLAKEAEWKAKVKANPKLLELDLGLVEAPQSD